MPYSARSSGNCEYGNVMHAIWNFVGLLLSGGGSFLSSAARLGGGKTAAPAATPATALACRKWRRVRCSTVSLLRCHAEDNIKIGRQLADLRLLDRVEVDRDGSSCLGVLDCLVDAILLVARIALDVALGREQLLAALLDLVVDVRRAAGVGDRLDRAEVIFTLAAREEPAKTLEVLVANVLLLGAVIGVQVHALGIALPDLDERVLHGIAFFVQDQTGQVRDVTDRRSDALVDNEEIVVGVERQLVGVERSFRLSRSADPLQLVGGGAGDGEEACHAEGCGTHRETTQETATAGNIQIVHNYLRGFADGRMA